MANQNNPPAFAPVDYSTGPFSENLKPPSQTQIPVPGAKIPRAAAAAAIIDKFLEGIQTGRVRAFEGQERQRAQKRQALDSAYAQIRQDHGEGRITEEGYNKATQVYFKSIGNLGMQELDGSGGQQQDGKKAPKKKQGQDQDQPQGIGGHVKNIAGSILTGLAGGKLTPGLDVGNALIDMQNSVYGKDGNPLPQYNSKALIAGTQEQLNKAAGALKSDATREEAQGVLQPMFEKLDSYGGNYGKQARTDFLSRYQPKPIPPPPGSAEDLNLKLEQKWATPKPPEVATGTGIPPLPNATPANRTPVPGAPPGAQQDQTGPPPITRSDLSDFISARRVTKEEKISYMGQDGKPVQTEGIRINIPGQGEYWYRRDMTGAPVAISNQGSVAPASLAQPTEDKPSNPVRMGKGQVDAQGNPIPEGEMARWETINGKTGWWRSNQTAAQNSTEAAERLYRETNHIPDGQDLTEQQKANATDKWKVMTDPSKRAKYGAPSGRVLSKMAATDPSFDIQAWDYLVNGKFDVRGRGADADKAANEIIARSQQIMKDSGLTAGDIFALREEKKANAGALARVTTQGAQVNQLEDQLQRNMKIATQLDAAFKRSDSPLLNSVQSAFTTGTGNSEAKNLAAQLHAVSREWAKLMQGQTSSAGVSIKESADTDKIISEKITSGQLKSLFDNVISKDATTRSQANAAERRGLLDSIRGVTKGPPDPSKKQESDPNSHPENQTVLKNSGHDISWFLGGTGGGNAAPAGSYDPSTGTLTIKKQ